MYMIKYLEVATVNIVDKLKNQLDNVKDDAVKEFIKEQLYQLKDNVQDFIDNNTPKSKSRRGQKEPVKVKEPYKDLEDNLHTLKARMSRVKADSYKELANYTRVKVATIVDDLNKLADKELIGVNTYNALVTAIEDTFNKPKGVEFSMRKVKKDFEKLFFEIVDELKLKERA